MKVSFRPSKLLQLGTVLAATAAVGCSSDSSPVEPEVASLIADGLVMGGPLGFPTTQAPVISLEFSLELQPDGSINGEAKLVSVAGSVEFELTSYDIGDDGRVSAAGPATAVNGSPAFGPDAEGDTPHIVEVGELVFFSVLDHGNGSQSFIEGKVPSFLPAESIDFIDTIQKVQDPAFGPGPAPAAIFRPVLSGHFTIH